MIEPMAKIEIIGLLDELEETLDLLQKIGTVQIDEIPTVESTREIHIRRIHLDETKTRLLEKYEELSLTIGEILELLGEHTVEEVPLTVETQNELAEMSPDKLLKQVSHISREIRRLSRQRKNMLQDMDSIKQYEMIIDAFLPLIEKSDSPEKMEQIGIILRHGESSVVQVIKNRLESITGPETRFFHQQMPDGETGVFIMVTQEDLPSVLQLLGNEGVNEYHIPQEFRKDNFLESLKAIRSRTDNLPIELEKIDQQLINIKKTNLALLLFIHTLSLNRLNQLKILAKLVRTRYTFMISGLDTGISIQKAERTT